MNTSMDEVQRLRDTTGAGIMECKRALDDSKGNFDEALKMYNAGVESVILPQVLGSNECLKQIQTFLATGKTISSKLKNEYINYLQEKIVQEKKFL